MSIHNRLLALPWPTAVLLHVFTGSGLLIVVVSCVSSRVVYAHVLSCMTLVAMHTHHGINGRLAIPAAGAKHMLLPTVTSRKQVNAICCCYSLHLLLHGSHPLSGVARHLSVADQCCLMARTTNAALLLVSCCLQQLAKVESKPGEACEFTCIRMLQQRLVDAVACISGAPDADRGNSSVLQ